MILHRLKDLRNDVVSVLWLSLSLFLGLSLYSYRAADPSWNSLGLNSKPLNWCGYLGSFSADFLYQFFGMSSWVFVVFLFFLSYQVLRSHQSTKTKKQIWLVLLLVASSALAELYFSHLKYYSGHVGVGGTIGSFLSVTLKKALNFYGATLFLTTFLAIGLLTITDWTLPGLGKKISTVLSFLGKTLWEGALRLVRGWHPLRSMAKRSLPKLPKRAHIPTIFNDDPEPFTHREPVVSMADDEDLWEEPTSEDIEEEAPRRRRRVQLKKKVQRKIANWKLPEIGMLEDPPASRYRVDQSEVNNKSKILVDKLSQFSVTGEVMGAKPGPAVTMFEFKPKADVKISKITELADDLSLALSSESVRIIAPIPGRDVVGIETSNANRETVYLKDIIAHEQFWNDDVKLPMALGREANGSPKVVDLRRMPHLLVAGTTGSGKSVFVVCALTGLLFRHSPKTLRLILIDPKQVDLSTFNDIPHLLMPTICEPKKAVSALKWAVKEMEKRYRSMSKFGARGLEAFNEKVADFDKDKIAQHEAYNQELDDQKRHNETYYYTPQPYIVIVVEEFGDLMAVDKANVEQLVVRLAQMARASGIHLILAMQSPRKDVVTGLIKTNIPGRISFKVASKMDSRIILDESGAERLLARGDMLFLAPGYAKPTRHHGPWVTESEIASIMDYWAEQGEPEYDQSAMNMTKGSGVSFADELGGEGGVEEYDERYDEILAWAASMKEVSASLIQRKFRIGYPRAARLIETMEREGVIGPANGSKPRQVLVNSFEDRQP
ncbi:MAG: DNA translocase FtsK [Bdellovibrionales bacterium]|nr:DNA translocase FtsK [Bdellovibrionales bacterium]